MSHDSANHPAQDKVRPVGRIAARELSAEEVAIAGGVANTTHATGPNGDDPSDPDLAV